MAPLAKHRQDRHVPQGSNWGPFDRKRPLRTHDFNDVTTANVFNLPCRPLVEVAPA